MILDGLVYGLFMCEFVVQKETALERKLQLKPQGSYPQGPEGFPHH